MFSPIWDFLSVAKRILNRRLAAGVWVFCIIGLFLLSHLALLRVEKTRDSYALSFQNSTIERLFQRLMISDHSLCGSVCNEKNNSGELKEIVASEIQNNNVNSIENEVINELELTNVRKEEMNPLDSIDDDEKTLVRDDSESTVKVELPEREVIAHPEQYQKDVAKKIRTEWTDEMLKAQLQLFNNRTEYVAKVCSSMTLTGALAAKMGSVFENMRWLPKHNLIWCPIFKAASTTWVKNLLMIAGESKIHERSLHARVRQLFGPPSDPGVRDRLLKESQKMLIVRHPLERLLSAYRDKMLRVRNAHDPFVRIQKSIMRIYPDPDAPPPSIPTLTTATDLPKSKKSMDKKEKLPTAHPTFKQYLMKVRDDLRTVWSNEGKIIVNMHWRPFWLTCAPCHVSYDFIGKVETLDLDQEYIIRVMGLQDLLYNSHTHASNFDSYNNTSEAAKEYFKQIPLSLLKDIVELYKPDFTLFDYSPDSYYKLGKPDD